MISGGYFGTEQGERISGQELLWRIEETVRSIAGRVARVEKGTVQIDDRRYNLLIQRIQFIEQSYISGSNEMELRINRRIGNQVNRLQQLIYDNDGMALRKEIKAVMSELQQLQDRTICNLNELKQGVISQFQMINQAINNKCQDRYDQRIGQLSEDLRVINNKCQQLEEGWNIINCRNVEEMGKVRQCCSEEKRRLDLVEERYLACINEAQLRDYQLSTQKQLGDLRKFLVGQYGSIRGQMLISANLYQVLLNEIEQIK